MSKNKSKIDDELEYMFVLVLSAPLILALIIFIGECVTTGCFWTK